MARWWARERLVGDAGVRGHLRDHLADGDAVSVLREGRDYVLAVAVCCRRWPVAWPARLSRCGFCGTVPVVVDLPSWPSERAVA